ncbi:MAG: DUF2059 domain-containing protein [Syntrophobacteraceae bacterium]|nr:DUF2059 domain-containing protein [Syntrophobacteraceae bacterium]
MRRLLFVLVILPIAIHSGFADAANIPREKQRVIEQLLRVSGYDKNFDASMKLLVEPLLQTMTLSLKKVQPILPDPALRIIREEASAVMSGAKAKKSLREKIYAVYDNTFTTEELRGLVNFYSSPLGRKVSAAMPEIIRESRTMTQAWALELIPELDRRIRKRLKAEKLLPRASQ